MTYKIIAYYGHNTEKQILVSSGMD